jgi:hypothetical protein
MSPRPPTPVGVRALSDYDDLFDLATTPGADATPRPDLRIVR